MCTVIPPPITAVVSVVSTSDRMAQIAGLPAYARTEASSLPSNDVPYRHAAIPGKGIGLVATRPIRAGQTALAKRQLSGLIGA
jgi:hypothetical protein